VTPGEPIDPAPARSGGLPKVALAVLLVCGLAALFWPRGAGRNEVPGGFLVDLTGRPSRIGDHLAPVTVVHFWATWCPPCITEIPAVLRLQKDIAAQGSVAVLMIAVGDSPEKVKRFLGERAGQALFDPRWDVAHRYGTQQLPETYVLVNGKVADKFVGATDWDAPQVRERLQAEIARARR
jgi:thiol-disulfide isomerase/thioredoxin